MRLTFGNLKTLICESLIIESTDVGAIANRGLGSYSVISSGDYGFEFLIVMSTKNKVNYHLSQGKMIPEIVAAVQGQFDNDCYILRTLYADNPLAAVFVLAAAVEHWKRVIPDKNVSPAAQAVLKRYYQQYQNDSDRIENAELGFLKAVYLAPIGFNLDAAMSKGEKEVQALVDKSNPHFKEPYLVTDVIARISKEGFARAHGDPRRTKISV